MLIPKKIRHRRVLVVLVTTSQALSMLLALWWFSAWLEDHLVHVIREQVLTNNQRITAQMVALTLEDVTDPPIPAFDDYGIAEAVSLSLTQVHGALVMVALVALYFGAASALTVLRRFDSGLLRRNDHLQEEVERRSASLLRARDSIIFGLGKLAEWRDDCTGRHLERIRDYVEILAEALSTGHPELDGDAVRMLGLTSSLHDIGKVGIPDSILLKAGPLSEAERAIIEQHPRIAGNCLLAIKERLGQDDPFLEMASDIALCHHERWDGQGYPHGLEGEAIPFSARIVALADMYDALTSRRVYKEAMSHEEARRLIAEEAGRQFDPEIVVAFLCCEEKIREAARGRRAEVTRTDWQPVEV